MDIESTEFIEYMTKKLQFVADWNKYTRKFTVVYVDNGELFIGHTISDKRTKIEFADLKEWLNYFDRI